MVYRGFGMTRTGKIGKFDKKNRGVFNEEKSMIVL